MITDNDISSDNAENLNFFQRIGSSIVDIFAAAGSAAVKFIGMMLLALFIGAKALVKEIASIFVDILRALKFILGGVTESLRHRIKRNNDLLKAARKAKQEGKKEYVTALLKFGGSFLFGDGGIFYTAFNYLMPVISVIFLINVVRYGSNLEYGLAVQYNGKDIGIIDSETDFDKAEREFQQRISYLEGESRMELSANYSLRIISDDDKFLSSDQLANLMLSSSDEPLTEAYGIYIDGKFIGAVKDKAPVQDALDNRLLNYQTDGIIKDISYRKKVEYTQGIYLEKSLMEQQAAIDLLTSSTKKKGSYVTQSGDNEVTVCQRYNMTLDEFKELNPNISVNMKAGTVVSVNETESYLPIQYVKEYTMPSFLDYETVEIETSSLNVGATKILVKGQLGEKITDVEVTYVDGIERARKIVSSKITKEPIVEQIGIGTYSAHPGPMNTIEMTGTGQFAWPIDGGYVSDVFISDRNHKGLDIAADTGTNIYAADDGVVVSAGWNPGGYGYFVQIDHLNGYQTVYGHMSSVLVTAKQPVVRGQLIGLVGSTGDSTGPHCHFEVRYENVCYNPADYLNTVDPSKYMPQVDEDEDEDKDKDKPKKKP